MSTWTGREARKRHSADGVRFSCSMHRESDASWCTRRMKQTVGVLSPLAGEGTGDFFKTFMIFAT